MKTRLSKTLMSSVLVAVLLLSAFFTHGSNASEALGASSIDSQEQVTDTNTPDFNSDARPEESVTNFETRETEDSESTSETSRTEDSESTYETNRTEDSETIFDTRETEETDQSEGIADKAEDSHLRYPSYDDQVASPDAEIPGSMYDTQSNESEIVYEESEASEYKDIIAATGAIGYDWQRLEAVINHTIFADIVQTIVIHPAYSRTEALENDTYHLVISDLDRLDNYTIRTVGLPTNHPISIGRNITINTSGGAITLLAGGNGRHFNVYDNAIITFDGNVILNGNDTGGGISTDSISGIYLTLNNAVIRDCRSNDNGGGIYHRSDAGSLTIIGGEFSGNTAAWSGGGIYAYNVLTISGDTIIENNTAGNTTQTGGGGVFANTPTALVTISDDVIIRGNTSSTNAGGIRANGSLQISGNVIIANNNASTAGGGIWAGRSLTISDDVVIENNSSSGSTGNGAGIFTDSTEQVTISDRVIIRGNVNENGAGGIHSNGPLEIRDNVIIANNRTQMHAGGIGANSLLTISGNVVIENNTARFDGAGIRAWLTAQVSISDNVIIRGNTSGGAGGGINTGGPLDISGAVLIENNTAGNSGGGIRGSDIMVIGSNVVFSSNSADTARNYASVTGRTALPNINWYGQNSLGGVASPASGIHLINNFDVSLPAILGTLIPAEDLRATIYHAEDGTELHSSQRLPGTQVRVAAAPEVREGYNFTWYATIEGNEVELAPNAIFTMPDENVLFFQRWTGAAITAGRDWQRLEIVINHADFRDIVQTIVIHPAGSRTEARVGDIYHLVISDTDRVDDNTIRTLGMITSQPITINRNITINSGDGDITLLSAGPSRHFNVSASSEMTFDGNIILNGDNTGGGIRTQTDSGINLTLNNAVVRDCIATNGGGVFHESVDGSLTINGGEFSGNRANSAGGGILSRSTGQVIVKDGVTIRDNTGGTNTGGIRAYGPLEIFGDVLIANNTAETNIAGGVLTENSLTISGNVVIENNTADWNGGGIRAVSSTAQVSIGGGVIIRGNTSYGNTGIRGSGGGINASGPLEISNDVVIENNVAALNGGGVFANDTTALVTIEDNVVIRGNTSINGSGGGIIARGLLEISGDVLIESNNSMINGGGIYLSLPTSTLEVGPDVIFGNNSAGTVRDYATAIGRAAFPNINWSGPNSLGGVASPAYGIHLINNFDVATATILGNVIPEANLRVVIFHAENGTELHRTQRLPGTQVRTIAAPEAREGYFFTWYADINGSEVEFGPNTTFTMPTEYVLFFPRWIVGELKMVRIPNEVDFGIRTLGDWSSFSLHDNESNSDIGADFLLPSNMWEYGFTVENTINSPSWQIMLHATPFINVDNSSLPPGADLWAVNGSLSSSLTDGFVVYTSDEAGTHSFHWAELLREIETRALPGIHTGKYQSTFTWTLSGELP